MSGSRRWASHPVCTSRISGRKAEGGHHGVERVQERRILSVCLEGDVRTRAVPVTLAHLLDEAGGGEEVEAALVDRDGEHVRVLVEHVLDAVAMVRIVIDVHHAQAVFALEPPDRHRQVVVDAEPGRGCGVGVVQTAGQAAASRRPSRPARLP